MIKTVKLALIALFLVMAGVLLTWFKLTQPRILVLRGGRVSGIDIKTGQVMTLGRITGLSGKDIVSIAVAK